MALTKDHDVNKAFSSDQARLVFRDWLLAMPETAPVFRDLITATVKKGFLTLRRRKSSADRGRPRR